MNYLLVFTFILMKLVGIIGFVFLVWKGHPIAGFILLILVISQGFTFKVTAEEENNTKEVE